MTQYGPPPPWQPENTQEVPVIGAQPAPRRRRRTGWIVALVVLLVAAVGTGLGGYVAMASSKGHTHTPTAVQSTKKPKTKVPKTVPASFAALYKKVASGVVRVNTTDCNGNSGVGTGFLLSPTVVATVNHVVDDAGVGATSLSVAASNGQTVSATVIGSAPNADLALLKLSSALPGHVFAVTPSVPAIGAQVAALGFPNGGPLSFGEGTIQDLGQTETVNLTATGTSVANLMQTDIAVEPGDSGGPVVTLAGQVVGLTDALTASSSPPTTYAVESSVAAADFSTWKATPSPQPLSDCTSTPAAPSTTPPSSPPAPSTASCTLAVQTNCSVVSSLLSSYYNDLNAGDYQDAWSLLSPHAQTAIGWTEFVDGHQGTYVSSWNIASIIANNVGNIVASVTFTSDQSSSQSPDGSTCNVWSLTYTVVQSGPLWYIDSSQGSYGDC